MNTLQHRTNIAIKELRLFLKTADFAKAVMVAFAVTIPILVGLLSGYLEIGLAVGFGAFWSSPSDVSGSYRHKKNGILFSGALITIVSLVGGYLDLKIWFELPIIGFLAFGIAFISVFGFRASLISFSGLLALVLSLARTTETLEVYQYAIFVGLGGLWYLLLAMLWDRLNPKGETEQYLYETYLLTADFLEIRGKLIGSGKERKELMKKLHNAQNELITHHSTLREILMHSRSRSGKSSYQGRRLLVFNQLVEILETAAANPVNYYKMDGVFKDHPEYAKNFQNLIFEMADQLRLIASAGNSFKNLPKNKPLRDCFDKIKNQISFLERELPHQNFEGFVMLQNFLEYQEKQLKKLRTIKRLLGDSDISAVESIDEDAPKLFIATQDYNPYILLRNLSFDSTIFKHSLRLSVTLMAGYALTMLFNQQSTYWVLLTIIVIMRPGYGLTKTRSKDRIIGTLIGGLLALGVVFLIKNPLIYGALGVVTLIFSLAMVQKNYRASATFVTLSVVFIYAIMRPDILAVIQFRVIDTLLGAGFSFIAILWLWPAWGYAEIKEDIANSVKANQIFLNEIALFYVNKGKVPLSYKFSRKQAFLETSNLNSAFQEMAQEPKSKQKHLDKTYELVELNHNFLSSLASLSAYIQSNPTTEASDIFRIGIEKIDNNLTSVLDSLKRKEQIALPEKFDDGSFYETQIELYQSQENWVDLLGNKELSRNYQEAHLIWEQLEWLFSLSANMLAATSEMELE